MDQVLYFAISMFKTTSVKKEFKVSATFAVARCFTREERFHSFPKSLLSVTFFSLRLP